jgi:hypothetical protein
MKVLRNLPFVFAILLSILLSSSGCMIALLASAKEGAKKGSFDKKDILRASEKTFSNTEMEKLKSSTTLFIVKDNEGDQMEAYQKAIDKVWDFTKVKVISFKELKNYNGKEGYSFFVINRFRKDVDTRNHVTGKGGLSYTYTEYYLTLSLPMEVKNKKGKTETNNVGFCRINLFPDTKTMNIGNLYDQDYNGNLYDTNLKNIGNLYDQSGVTYRLYTEGHFKNLNPAMVSLYLEQVQKDLKASKRIWLFEESKDKNELKKLANKTLLIPDYVLEKFNKFNGEESVREDKKELFKKYPYKYKIVTKEELNQEIQSANETLYILDYVKNVSSKCVSVYSTKKGLIYKSYTPRSYNLKSRDLKAIVK